MHPQARKSLTSAIVIAALAASSAARAQDTTFSLWNSFVNGSQLDETGVIQLALFYRAELGVYAAYADLCQQHFPEADTAAAELKLHVEGMDDAVTEFLDRYSPTEIAAFPTAFDADVERAIEEQKGALPEQFQLEDPEALQESCAETRELLRATEPAVAVVRGKNDVEYQQRVFEAELADKYSPELVAQALAAEYPSFGFPVPALGSEEAYYGRNHPLRSKLRAGRELTALIRAGRYDELEAYFGEFQQAFDKDALPEKVYADAFNWQQFGEASSEDRPEFEAWAEAVPESWLPHAMLGLYSTQMLWTLRGTGFANEIPEEAGAAIAEYFNLAETSLTRALEINPDFLAAYYALVTNAKFDGGADDQAIFDAAAARFPTSYELRWNYLDGLRPRWGGSYLEVRMFALDSQRHAGENPRMQALLGMEIIDDADAALCRRGPDCANDAALGQELLEQVQLHGVNGSQLYRLSNSLLASGQRDAAAEHWEYILRHIPGPDAVASGQQLAVYEFTGPEPAKAWPYLEEAINHAPAGQFDDSLMNMVIALDAERAKTWFAERASAHPVSPDYHYQLAYVYHNSRDSRTTDTYRQFISLCTAGACQAAHEEQARAWLACIDQQPECTLPRARYEWALNTP